MDRDEVTMFSCTGCGCIGLLIVGIVLIGAALGLAAGVAEWVAGLFA